MQFVKSDADVQSYLFLLGLALIALIPVVGLFAAATIGGSILAAQTINMLAGIDQALQAAATRAEAIKIASSAEVRRQVVLNVVLGVLAIVGLTKGVSEINQFLQFREAMPISVQSELPILKQVEIFKTVRNLGISPDSLQFYLDHITSGDNRLAGLSPVEGLRVSDLAVRSGKGAFVLDYVTRYGYTDALQLATPEVLRGMVYDRFLVQAQEMLSQDTGYNISPEHWFTDFDRIGKNGTFITNRAAIETVIGKFEGKGTIQISPVKAAMLEEALGLVRGSLSDGFRVSTITEINNMELVFPVDVKNPRFLGPGKGLPGGGTELIASPSLPVDSPFIVQQVIVEVVP